MSFYRDDQPYHVAVLKDLINTGYKNVAKEINQILREEHQRRRPVACLQENKNYVIKYAKMGLVDQKEKFLMIVEKLIYAQDACSNSQ